MSAPTIPTTPRGEAFAKSLPALKPFHRRVFLLRHGQTDWNQRGLMQGGGFDIALNANGKQQAAFLASELSAISMGVIASSHLQRARQTANAILVDESVPRVIDTRLGEMRFGEFEGTCIHGPNAVPDHVARYQSILQAMKQDVNLAWPGEGAESTLCVSQRGVAALEALLHNHPDERHLAVVAHGRFNKIILATLLWKDPSRYVEIDQGNTCINVLDYCEENDTWTPIVINYTDHAPNANTKEALRKQQLQQQQQQQRQQQADEKAASASVEQQQHQERQQQQQQQKVVIAASSAQ